MKLFEQLRQYLITLLGGYVSQHTDPESAVTLDEIIHLVPQRGSLIIDPDLDRNGVLLHYRHNAGTHDMPVIYSEKLLIIQEELTLVHAPAQISHSRVHDLIERTIYRAEEHQ